MSADPKGALNHLCQKLCKRPITKQDVVYALACLSGRWEARVTLNCLRGLEFKTEIRPPPDRKVAERAVASAALEALSAPMPLGAPSLTSIGKPPLAPVLPPGPVARPPPRPPGRQCEPVLPPPTIIPNEASVSALPEGIGPNPKTALNEALGKIVKGVLTKDSTVYSTETVLGGFLATLSLPCLPGGWAQLGWPSQICAKKKDAESSAAATALAAILQDPQFAAMMFTPRNATSSGSWKNGGGKGGIRQQQSRLTSAAPKTQLRISLEGEGEVLEKPPLMSVEISPSTTLQSVRALIGSTRIPGLPNNDYLFVSHGVPVPSDQESALVARDFLPGITVTSADLRGVARRRRPHRPPSPPPAPPQEQASVSAPISECSSPAAQSVPRPERRARSRSRWDDCRRHSHHYSSWQPVGRPASWGEEWQGPQCSRSRTPPAAERSIILRPRRR